MKRPRLTIRVLRGLRAMANVYEAGAYRDMFGNEPTTPEERKNKADVDADCQWVGRMFVWRARKRAAR